MSDMAAVLIVSEVVVDKIVAGAEFLNHLYVNAPVVFVPGGIV